MDKLRVIFWGVSLLFALVFFGALFLGGMLSGEKELPPIPRNFFKEQTEKLSLEEKIGQMFMFGFENDSAWTEEFLKEKHIGGVLLLKNNIQNPEQLRKLTKNLQEKTRNPLSPPIFIAVDQEGGAINRVFFAEEKRGARSIKDSKTAFEVGKKRAEELRSFGINVNFAPVLDIVDDQESFLYRRTFSGTSAEVAVLGAATIRGQRDGGVISSAKHFPGHGATITDSHKSLPVSLIGERELRETHLIPFIGAIQEGVEMIMAAHILFPEIDENPVPFSEKFIRGIIREELKFTGVVITDDLNMGAITNTYPIGEAVLNAIEAGVDLLLIAGPESSQRKAYDTIYEAVRSGIISKERIDQSLYRIIKLKQTWQLD